MIDPLNTDALRELANVAKAKHVGCILVESDLMLEVLNALAEAQECAAESRVIPMPWGPSVVIRRR